MTPAPPFDPLAELYERYAQVTDDLYRPWLSAAIPDRSADPTSRAVDLGCGSGRFTGLLADRYSQVLAVDIAEREIALARRRRRRPNVSYQARSLLDVTPRTDGRFDLVLSVNTLFHLCDHDRALPHVRDLLAPGGTLVVVDVVADSPHLRRPAWQHWQTLRDAARTLRRRRRLPDAVAVLRLRLHPAWMTHVTTSTPLTRTGFHHTYGQAFPGATFTDTLDPFLCALRWRAPGTPDPAGR